MDTHTQPADRAVLHVVPDQNATTQPMHEALLQTGRTLLMRCDLYQAMGALAGSQRETPIEAVFISAATVCHDDGEFFDIVPRAFPDVAIYVYGASAGPADRIFQQSTAIRIDPEAVGPLFEEPKWTLPRNASVPKTEVAPESSPVASAMDAPSELEQRLLRSLDEEGASRPITSADDLPDHSAEPHESDHSHVAEVDCNHLTPSGAAPTELDDPEDRPPVPWNPSLARPARTPPRQDGVLEVVDDAEDQDQTIDDYAGQSDTDPPLLTREELDALLREGHDSTGELEHRR
jgi:hypothetical protein